MHLISAVACRLVWQLTKLKRLSFFVWLLCVVLLHIWRFEMGWLMAVIVFVALALMIGEVD